MIYEELTKSILVFKNLSDELIDDMINLKNKLLKQKQENLPLDLDGNFAGTENRFEVYSDKKLFDKFNEFWFNNIEDLWQTHFLKYVENHSHDSTYATSKAREHNKTRWKDLFIHRYTNDTVHNNPSHIDFSGLSFTCPLNDTYLGGELYFPRQNVTYKPKKGELVVFPGGITHPHRVNSVTDGERLVLVGQTLGPPQKFELGKMKNKLI